MRVFRIDHEGQRVETGPVQFGNDWPGVFIRGDNAMYYAMMLRIAIACIGDTGAGGVKSNLESLERVLQSCVVSDSPEAKQ